MNPLLCQGYYDIEFLHEKMQNSVMENTYDSESARLVIDETPYRYVDLPGLFGKRLQELPVVLRLLLENVIRNTRGEERRHAVEAIMAWPEKATSQEEIPFHPGRILMHDTTSTPAFVDIAGMRDTLAEGGSDPEAMNPVLPVDSSVDHSLAVEYFARADAAPLNMDMELRRNAERYRFMRWASRALKGVRIHPPGTGILHTINLEQLATVVASLTFDGEPWLAPDTLIGTDSHTPMINGIGVLAWGVGGLEAESVMFGMPVIQRIPDVVGVRLTGMLRPGVLATDLVLTVTQKLRAIGVSSQFVEFFGSGVSTLSAGERAVVANMAPEYGATTGFFPVDERTLEYLRATNRPDTLVRTVRAYTRSTGLWFNPDALPVYTKVVEIDLSAIGLCIAGPRRPQDLHDYSRAARVLSGIDFHPSQADPAMPRHPVAIAAITSCTNTSDPSLLIAAGLLARKARKLGLTVPPWVKTSLAPGSPAASVYLKRVGLTDDLAAVGFDIVGFGCTTCIGNSGSLTDVIQEGMARKSIHPVAVLSGNRNFPGRIHPELDLGFLMSPPLVVAFALAGNAEIDLSRDPVGRRQDGTPVTLAELWPKPDEVAELALRATHPQDYPDAFAQASRNAGWDAIEVPDTPRFPWNPDSTILRRPPFTDARQGPLTGSYRAYPLLVLGDDITTDHISPASAIPGKGAVADFLVERGEDRNDLNVFSSRRGNWEVMVRGAFTNRNLVNRAAPHLPAGQTLHMPSGTVMSIFEAAQRYRQDNDPVVLIAGERYGAGSSRDWAAKAQRLLGIRAVLAMSFERIHRSNLIGMGILPLQFASGAGPDALGLRPGDRLGIDAPPETLAPHCAIQVRILRHDGGSDALELRAAVETHLECTLLRLGGIIPLMLQKTSAKHAKRTQA